MEDKENEAKRARTVRYEYHRDVEQVQTWICQAEGRVQDRNLEPQTLKEFLQELQCEIGLITDQMERVSRHGTLICQRTRDEHEQQLVRTTLSNLTDQLQQVRSWLEEKRLQVGDSIDSWQRFLQLHSLVVAWVEEKKGFLAEPLHLTSLVQARQKSQDYNMAVKSCKVATKNVSDMGKELSRISQVSSVGALADQMAEAEQSKTEVETQLQERSALLQEMTEEWEQCEKKLKDVKAWLEKARQTLDSPLNKKRPLRDQLSLREKMLGDVTIQKTKINMSIEKLQVHFRSGVTGSPDVVHSSVELIEQLDALLSEINQQSKTLEAAVIQLDQLQQEIQGLRAQVVQVDQQLRLVSSPAYSPLDRDKALAEQNALQAHQCAVCQQIQQLRMRMTEIDPQLTLADDGIERSLMAAAADWQFRAPMEPNRPALPLPVSQTSTVAQSIPPTTTPPRSDDVQASARDTVTSTSAAAVKSAALLSLDKFSYADIAAGRRSPSVSRQATVETVPVEPIETAVEPTSPQEPVTEQEIEPVLIVESHSGRSRWEQQQQDKLVQSVDAEQKHPSRSELRRRQQKRPAHQDSHASRERSHPPVTQVKSLEVPEETPVQQEVVKMEQETALPAESAHRPKTAAVPARSPANLSPPGESEKRSRSPLWLPGTGGPSYADILRGHYIPHHQRGMVGIVDAPQQQSPQEQQLHQIGGASIDETNEPEEHVPKQQFVPPEPIEEVSSPVAEQAPPSAPESDAGWMSRPVYEQPMVQQVDYPSSMFQPSNLSFETQYASAPDAEAVFAANFDLMALRQAYAQLAYPMPVYPAQQLPSAHQNFEFNIEQPRQEYAPPSAPPQEPEPVQVVEAAVPVVPQEVPAVPVEIPKPAPTTKLSYAQILSTGLQLPSDSERRDSSGSGHTSVSPRPSPKASPNVSDNKTDSAPSPSRISVPERGVSEPREHRSRQRQLKASKSKSFDVREKEPAKPKYSKPSALPVRPAEAKNRFKKQKSYKSFSEEPSSETTQWAPVSVQVSPPENKLAVPAEPSASRSKSPGSAPTSSEPEMTKAMMTFYGISSEDIEQLISSRSHDSDSEAEAAGVEASAEKKKKKVQKLKKRKSSKVPDEDEIEKALREISELEKNKRSKMKRTHSHEMKNSEPAAEPVEVIPVVTLELPDQAVKSKQKEKKLRKAASVSGGHPIKSSLKPEMCLLTESSATTGESSSGSSDPSAQKQRRDRIKRAKTVSFNQENVTAQEPIIEVSPKRRLSSPPADPESIAQENEAEFDVLDTQGLETVGHLVTEVEKMMEDAMSDDIVVLETENLAFSPVEGQRTLDPQILEDVFTETASVFETPVCPEMYQEEEEEECLEQVDEKSVAVPEEPVAASADEPTTEERPKSSLVLGPIMVAEENKSDEKIPSEMTGELPLGSQPAAAMTLLPLEVRVTLRKISACNTVPFLPEEIQLPLEDDSVRHQPLRAAESVDLDSASLEVAAAMVFNQTDIETVDELEQDDTSFNADVAGSEQLTCISAITHMAPVTLSVVEQLPMLARQLSLAEEEFADESELSLPICTTPIPAMVEREEEALISATTEEPPATNVYTPQVELPTQEQMVNIVDALLEEPKTAEIIEPPITVKLTESVETLPAVSSPTVVESSQPATKPVPLVTLAQVDAPAVESAPSVSSPGSDYKAPTSPFGFDDADHVVLSPQWMRQRSPLGRTFSLDPRTLSAKATSPLVKAHSTDLSESYGTEEQKAAAAAKNQDEGSKSESQTGGEADDEDVEVYWRLREKKKKKKRRAPITTGQTTNAGPRVSESSSDAFSLAEMPMSPTSGAASDLPVSESTLTSDDEHRTKCTQDDGFQSGLSTPILMTVTSPDSELRETLRELSVETELASETLLETSIAESPIATPTELALNELPADPVPILAGPCLLEMPPQLEQPEEPKLEEEVTVEMEVLEQIAQAVEESPVALITEAIQQSTDVPVCQASSWANLVATGKPKITEPIPEPEPAPRPPRPLPTLIVVGEDEHHEAPCDPEGFHIGRKERRYMRKWRSSQSESQDVEEAEQTEIAAETLPAVTEPVEEIVDIKPVPPPSPAEIDSESDEEMPEPVRVNLRAKVQKVAKTVRELEQRKRRSRLSESEQEVLELAEAIADKHVTCIRTPHDDHLEHLYLDSWPKHTKTNLESLLWIAQQSQESIPEISEIQPTEIKQIESDVIDQAPSCQIIESAVDVEPIETEEAAQPVEDVKEEIHHEEPSQPCVLSWAKLVATSKPVVTESKEELVEEPVRPKRPLPTLVVVGNVEEPAPVETDPDSFTEFVGRNERRRRKWRSSQSESQDYATDEEHIEPAHIETSVVKEEPEIDAPVECPAPIAPIKEQSKETDSDEEEKADVPVQRHKKATTAKAYIPVKETEQRRRRARLSESEKEALDIAEAIEHGQTSPQLYYDLFADSWPLPFYVLLRDAETRWKIHESLASQPSPIEDQQQVQEPVEICKSIEQPTEICQTVEELVQESVPSDVQEETILVDPESQDEIPSISEIVITECPEEPMVVKPLTWAAMVALSKPPPAPVEIPEAPEQVAPRPSKTPLLLVYGEEEHHEPISSDDPDGFHECVSKREKRRRKWRSSQSESQDADFVVIEPEIVSEVVSTSSALPVEPVVEELPELRERSGSKSKRIAAKTEKQTKEVERKRPKRQSESEREALQLAEAIESGQDVVKATAVADSYWHDKLMYSDIEKKWQESLSGAASSQLDDKVRTDKSTRDRRSPDSDPKGPSPPQSPPSSDESPSSSSRLPTSQNVNADLPGGPANWSDESTLLANESNQEDQQQIVYKKELSTDLDDLMTLLQQAEKDLQQYNTKQIKERLPLVESVIESLEDMEPRLIDVDEKVKHIKDEDPEVDSLRAAVAGLRTRHITLESQACRYKQKLEDIAEAAAPEPQQEIKSEENEDLKRYQSLLSDLDDWVNSTHGQLRAEIPKFTSISAVLKEMDSSKRLEQEIADRNSQLADLMKRCGALQHSVAETEPLATQLYEHLVALQGSFAEAGAQLHSRLLLLQACLVELEEREGNVDPVQSSNETGTPDTTIDDDDTPTKTAIHDEPIEQTVEAQCPINEEADDAIATPSAFVQKTVRVIRRTILQNGREISVEEQIEEETIVPTVAETEQVPSKRRVTPQLFQIPSPFGIVEEPNFPDKKQTKHDERGSVEITDVTDQYSHDGREATSNVADPSVDQVVEIHEILDDVKVVEQLPAQQVIEVIGSPHDDIELSQSRTVFETLHEHEEEPEEDEVKPDDVQATTKADDDGLEAKIQDETEQVAEFEKEIQPQIEPTLQELKEEIKLEVVADLVEGLELVGSEEITQEPHDEPKEEVIPAQPIVEVQEEPVVQETTLIDEIQPQEELVEPTIEIQEQLEDKIEVDPLEEPRAELVTTLEQEPINEVEKSPECQEPVKDLQAGPISELEEAPPKEPQELQTEIYVLENVPKIEIDFASAEVQQRATTEPDQSKDTLQEPVVMEKMEQEVPELVLTDTCNIQTHLKPVSVGDDSESDVDNMDWNVMPDDERQFDEYFKEDRPSSVSSGSSTSTDTTHLESVSGEFVEDTEPPVSPLADSPRTTPLKEVVDQISENAEEKSPEDVLIPQTTEPEQSSTDEPEHKAEEAIPVVDEQLEKVEGQVLEPVDTPKTEKTSTIEPAVSEAGKIPAELTELASQIVAQVLKSVESDPVIERLRSEAVTTSAPEESSSSGSSSSSEYENYQLCADDEAVEDLPKEQTESVPESETIIEQQLDVVPPVESDIQPVNLKDVQLEPVKETLEISKSTKTETSTNVTLIRVGYEEPVEEEQQVAEAPTLESEKVVQLGEQILDTLPDIVDKLESMEALIESDEKDGAVERAQSQEEELTKERGDAFNTLTEHREPVEPTFGENTTGPPIDDAQILEQVARLVSDRAALISQEAQQEELDTQWQEIQNLLVDRLDQLRQDAKSSTQTSSVRYLATVTQVTVDESVEERKVKLNDNLAALKTAVQRREVVVIQRIVITIVRTVTEWLETIEYRVYTIKQTKSMERRTEQIQSLCEEVRVVEESLNTLEEVTEMAVEVVNEETKILLHKCVKSLQQQMQKISEVTKRSEGEIEHIKRQWEEYLDRINGEEDRIRDLINQLRLLQSAEQQASQDKLVQLEDIETAVQERLEGVTGLLHSGHDLVKETPFYQMPDNAYALLDTIKDIEESVRDERNVLLHKAALTAEYRQTLQEFAEIVRLSEALTASKLPASSPPEACQELEKRQRFLFCLSHFLQVLDALEPHLDLDTRSLCQDLHAELVVQAGSILDRAVSRQEIIEMALASWEQLELQWLQEEQWSREFQIPDTSNISSENFDPLIERLKDVLESMEHHRSVAAQLMDSTKSLDNLFTDAGLEFKFQERAQQLQAMINDVKASHRRLVSSSEHWIKFQKFSSLIDPWLKETSVRLSMLVNKAERGRLSHEDCLEYWVVKADTEEKQQEWEQAKTQLDRAVALVSIVEEDANRRFCTEVDESFIQLIKELQSVEKSLIQGLSQEEDVLLDDRLTCIECSHARIQCALDQLPVKYGSPEEVTTRRKELQALYNFTEWQLKEISALGASNPHLAADRAEHLGVLARRTKEMTNDIHQRLEKLRQVHQWMISFQRLYSTTSRRLQEVFICLQKASIYRDPLWLAQAAQLCEESERELHSIDVETAKLQRHLEVCPKDGATAAVDEASFAESIQQLDQSRQRSRDLLLLTQASVADRLQRWKLFEDSVNRVLCLIKRLKYARNMASLKGSVDLQRLLAAKQSIETIHEELTTNQHLVPEVGQLAEPFEAQAAERAADIGVQWSQLESSLGRLSNCYGHAAADWMGIEAELDDIQQWCSVKIDWSQRSVIPGEEEETLAQIQAIGEELLLQQDRLERGRLAASELGRSIAMSPVVVDVSIVVGTDATSATMPVSLATTADHVDQQLQLLQRSISVLADIAERQRSAVSNCNGAVLSAEKRINTARQTLCTVEEDANGERIEDQLVVLRDQLLQLSPTEQQLNSAPISEQLPVTVEIRPQAALCATSTTIQTTLQQWESIFQKTFAEYERLLNKLQDRCDESATAQVWRDHLDQAEKYLSRSLPDQYLSTCEDRDLCELHENLLIRHHSVFQSTQSRSDVREVEPARPTEELVEPEVACNLQGLHQAVLARIRQRHAALSDRALAWEQYRSALSKLLSWLDAAERERKHLVLRQIQEHGLPTALHRVEVLLDKIGQGQRVQGELDRSARQLLEKLGDEESASTVRADLKSAAARLTDLEAGLCTWRDFLQRVARLYQNLEKGVESIRDQLQSVQADMLADNELPRSPEAAGQLLQHYREQLLTVQTLSSDVEKQEVVASEIRSCVNIPDAKRIWQRLAALQIRRSETEDRLNSMIQVLEEHQDLPKDFELRYGRFTNWATNMEQRLLHKQRALVDDMVQRLSGPLRDELAAKECEKRWLVDQGRELSLICIDERRNLIEIQVANVEEIWRKLMETWNQELQRLQQLPTDLDGLNNSLAELTIWLGQAEATINAPLTIAACNQAAVETRLAEHADLVKSIEEKTPIVTSVLDLCNSFTSNYTLLHGWLGTDLDAVQCATQSLQRRWKSICLLSDERSALLQSLWSDWSTILDLNGQLIRAMSDIEEQTPSDASGTSSSFEVEQLNGLLESLIQELHSPAIRQKLDQLNEKYCILARDGRVDAAGELQQIVARLNASWRDLSDRLSALLHTTRESSSLIHHWQGLRDRLLVWCSHCEVQVQQMESDALCGETDPTEALNSLKEELQVLENARTEIRELGKALIKQGTADMQPQLDEYLQIEDDVLLRLAQMQVRLAQKEQDRQANSSLVAENISMSDSGVYSYALEPEATQGLASVVTDENAILLPVPTQRIATVSVGTSTKQQVPPAKPVDEPPVTATGAKQRTYADVTKTPTMPSSPSRLTPTVSIKSDTQRHLELALDEWRQRLARLDHLIKTTIGTEPSPDAANEIARMVATCRSSYDLTQHLCDRLASESSSNEPKVENLSVQTASLRDEFQQLEMLAKTKERNLRDERKTWAQQEQDLWRLERWLEHAENQFRAHERIPTNMEQLEDTVQDFRELSLDLDSHKNIIMSLNIVVNHVAQHAVTADLRAADRLRSRLAAANSRWEAVCKSAGRIQGRLQAALMQNEEYHRTIRDLVSWLERTEADIQNAEPIDLTVGTKQLKAQLTKFQDLHAQLSQFEPRVTSMREIADQVFAQSAAADSAQLRSKLALLNDRLTSLLRICSQYKQLLDGALRNRGASMSPSTPSGLNLSPPSHDSRSPHRSIVVLPPTTESTGRSPSPRVPRASSMDERAFTSTVHSNIAAATASTLASTLPALDQEESGGNAAAAAAVDTSVLQRGYRFFGRVIRTALPIQAVMLLVLGVASLVPTGNDSCMDANTFANSLEFVLRYPDGAPPT